MILTASNIDSVSRSLSRWEWGEYISEAFVIIACAGELVADLDLSWLTEERRKHLQRRSTILLVAALSVSLICLVRTNELSGSVIGSLGDKAGVAETKAQSALEAADKADAADASADRAMRKAREAEEYAAPRSISVKQAALIRKRIQSLKGHKIVFFGNFNETEISDFGNQMSATLDNGIMDITVGFWKAGMVTPSGMKFGNGKDRKADFELIVNALDEAGVEKAGVLRKKASMVGIPDDWLTITFGAKH